MVLNRSGHGEGKGRSSDNSMSGSCESSIGDYTRIELLCKDVAFEGPFTYGADKAIIIRMPRQAILRAGRVKIDVATLGYAA